MADFVTRKRLVCFAFGEERGGLGCCFVFSISIGNLMICVCILCFVNDFSPILQWP